MPKPPRSLEEIKEAASTWVPRLDAGLSEEEEREFEAWIEADPRHAEVLAEQQAIWERFGALVPSVSRVRPEPDLFAPRPRGRPHWLYLTTAVAAAAAVAFGFVLWRTSPGRSEAPLVLPAPLAQRVLPDGSTVELNRGAEIAVDYSMTQRRIKLLQGEAHFSVARNPDAPFIVSAGGVEVQAIGTAFNVRFEPSAVEVVVSHGRVAVSPQANAMTKISLGSQTELPASADRPLGLFLEAGQSTKVQLSPAAKLPEVATLSPEEMEARLAWQPKRLDFDDAPLSVIVMEFNRHNPVRLVIRDSSLASLRLNASFRSDNMEGFVRILAQNFNIHAEAISPTEIELRRTR